MARQTVAACIAQMLDDYGVTHVFYLPAVLRAMLVELERRTPIARIHAHSEAGAAYMADGYARASGRPGICMAQIVGALNLCAGLRDAWLAHAPVIAMTGGRDPRLRDRWAYQEVDDLPAFVNYTKMNAAVDDPVRVPDMLRQAFRVAVSGNPGPVHLQFRGNAGQMDEEEAELAPLAEPLYGQVPAHRPEPDTGQVVRAVERIAQAERPVLVAGGGVRHSGAGAALVRLAEAVGAPIATSLNAKDAVPATHPLSVGVVGTYSRRAANQVVAEADLVVFVGTRAGGMTTHFWTVPTPGTAAVQIDIDPAVTGRNYPCDVAVIGDARTALERMAERNQPLPEGRAAWLARARSLCRLYEEETAPLLASEAVPIRPERIVGELTRAMPEDALVVVDTGHAGMWMGGMFDLTAPGQSYIRSAGHLGWAFPAGLGVKCGQPHRPVVAFTGDLGFWYHMAEVETAVRCGIDTVTVINNNRSGNQALKSTRRLYGGRLSDRAGELWMTGETDFARLARDMGALGIRVTRPGEFAPAFAAALAAGRPAVIDVVTDIEAVAPLAWEPPPG